MLWQLPTNIAGLIEDEERKKEVMGMSALGKCLLLVDLSDMFETEIGSSDTSKILETFKAQHVKMDGWNPDTMSRYIGVGRRLKRQAAVLELLHTWEFTHGRNTCFDGITALRAFIGLGQL